jgi:hypothetical protein
MNTTTMERLYGLLPSVYRLRDADLGEPLRALLGVLEREHQLVEGDIEHLYDNWFIETCDEWVVSYIGDLLGVSGLLASQPGAFTQRGLVANTLAHRQGKGTAATLEQVARDVTGWPAKTMEFFRRLATTQQLNHLIVSPPATVDLRDIDRIELIDGPFDGSTHTADLRHADNGRGRYNIPHVGIFLWRLQSYPLKRVTARAVANPADGRYTFDPLGNTLPLFNQPQTEIDTRQSIAEIDVPAPLRRLPLYTELEVRRQAKVDRQTPDPGHFGPNPVFQVFLEGSEDPVPPERILICNLSDPPAPATDWRRPPVAKPYAPTPPQGTTQMPPVENLAIAVAVDPALGRLAFPTGVSHTRVEVSFSYGFSGDLGGGPYNRQDSVAAWLSSYEGSALWQKGVTQAADAVQVDAANLVLTIGEAIQEWNSQPAGTVGIVTVMDSHMYAEALTGPASVTIPAGSALLIVAADWPLVQLADDPTRSARVPGQLAPVGVRPLLRGSIAVQGNAVADSVDPGSLTINGLLIEGGLSILPGNLGALQVIHSTLAPPAGTINVGAGVPVEQRNDNLAVTLQRAITGPIKLASSVRLLTIRDSIVDAGGDEAAAISGPAADVQRSTVRGQITVKSLTAGNSIFTGALTVVRRQTGCARFCYIPAGSLTPRRYRCQLADGIVPSFTSLAFGQAGYGQLAQNNPEAIITGAEDEGEMGAFGFLQQTQRLGSLRARLGDYLRVGLEAGTFFST